MRKLLLGFWIALTFTACKKNGDATPDAGAAVAGTYQMTSFGIDEGDGTGYQEIPLPLNTAPLSASGVITTTRTDANNINLAAKVSIVQGDSSITLELPNPFPVALQKNGNSYDMLRSGSKIGTADGTNVAVDITQPASGTTSASRISFKGKR